MEAFSLLKYWRGGGGGGGGDLAGSFRPTSGVATIVTAVSQNTAETDDDDDDGDDDGPFFDLEFAVNDEDEAEVGEVAQSRDEPGGGSGNSANDSDLEEEDEENDDDDDDDDDEGCNGDEREFNFTLSSGSSNDRTDPNLSLSPSDDLFFKGKLVPIESSSIVFSPSEPNSKPAQFPVSLLKSATRFRVFMLGLKKSRSNNNDSNKNGNNGGEKTESSVNGSVFSAPKQQPRKQEAQQKEPEKPSQENQQQGKFFTVKFKVEEVPIVSLFTRDNSSRVSNNKSQQKQSPDTETATSEEKRFPKEVMQKYLKMVKPLYVRVSKRYGEKVRFSGQLSHNGSVTKAASTPAATAASPAQKPITTPSPATASVEKSQTAEPEIAEAPISNNAKSLKQVNLPAGLRVVCKHLGKSRSASSGAAVVPAGTASSKRRDDSLLQQQDGIQSAILHCKRSFNAARDSESNLLSRCVSDPSNEKSLDLSRKSSDVAKVGGNQRP
ncbi:putative membrane-associated kinase regulator [Parasponia andersonii]|uniref:Putative membrane-associated kinase regulator n=1 Tax=Parasponia andersonii TaxID=3476 RepID=A0A2P5B512_PARAD|nr:putative membrane-associated kinase regulator [Parasponia andersonii]